MRHRIAMIVFLFLPLTSCVSKDDIERWDNQLASQDAGVGEDELKEPSRKRYQPITHPDVRDLDDLLELPDEEFDLTLGLLLFAKEYSGREVDVDGWLEKTATWKRELRERVPASASIPFKRKRLQRYVHAVQGFGFDTSDPKGYKVDNLFFDRVLQRRHGYCVTLSMVYLMLGEAIELDVRGTRLPGHFAVLAPKEEREGGGWLYIEATDVGSTRSMTDLYVRYRMSGQSIHENGVFLAPLSHKAAFASLYSNLGSLELLRGNDDEAEKHFDRALALSSKNLEARFNRSTIWYKRNPGGERIHDVLAELKAILEWDPNYYPAYARRASIYHKFGDREQAQKDLAKAKAIRPNLPFAYVEEGVMLATDGDEEAAIRAFEAALARDKDNIDALRNLAILEERLGNFEEAERYRERLRRVQKILS